MFSVKREKTPTEKTLIVKHMAAVAMRTRFKLSSRPLFFCRRCFHSNVKEIEVDSSDRNKLKLSTGKYARLADGCCIASSGNTNVMATVVSKQTISSSASFLPLTVDFRQKSAAVGKIATNFLRRDFGTNERETLTSRVIDRSIRPLFPRGYFFDTQVVCNLLSFDGANDPDVLSINAASAALALSDIPWGGPVGAVRVCLIENEIVINPTRNELDLSKGSIIITGTKDKYILMIEGSCNDPILMQDMTKVLKEGLKATQKVIKGIEELQKAVAKPKRIIDKYFVPTDEQIEAVKAIAETRLREIMTDYVHDKFTRDNEFTKLRNDVMLKLKENFVDQEHSVLSEAFNMVQKNIYKEIVFESNKRCDGRLPTELRNIGCEVNVLKTLHGSSVFQRGQTQVMCSLTLDSLDSAMKIDAISALLGSAREKNFMLHYEFPSFATNEIGRTGALGRREIGHGALAEKALRAVVPSEFPFTIRLHCEVLESNGSSSMASVCAGSLALLDAGIDVTPTSGVAIGLLTRNEEKVVSESEKKFSNTEYKILTDILGLEDYLGEMDFKIASTKKGFTALQLDTKLSEGLPFNIVIDALHNALTANKEIISKMNSVIAKPNESKQELWPVIEKIQVPPHKRSKFIGFSGNNIRRLVDQIGVRINADEESDNTFVVFARNKEVMNEAMELISKLLIESDSEPQLDFGGIYAAKIVEIKDNGVMIELYPNMRPVLLHLRELDQRKIAHPSALGFETGQEIQVKYFGRDPVSGHMRISRRVLQITNAKAQSFIHNKE